MRAIAITVTISTGPIVTLLFGVGQHFGFGRSQFRVVARFLAVLTLRDVALVLCGDGLTRFQRREFGAIAVVPAILQFCELR